MAHSPKATAVHVRLVMTRARAQLVSLEATPYYHCISRCVRRAYLCGEDPVSQRNFDHRKVWLVERIKDLTAVFAVRVCAYAVMSNHYHIVLQVDADSAMKWSEEEVERRWIQVFPRLGLVTGTTVSLTAAARRKRTESWRARLMDISWFMRCLNEFIARRANREDDCTGRFWEGRFKSQALLDERALIACMAYVDLNPMRAGVSKSLEESDFTSIQERLVAHARRVRAPSSGQRKLLRRFSQYYESQLPVGSYRNRLMPMNGDATAPGGRPLAMTQRDYLELLTWTSKELVARNITATLQDVRPPRVLDTLAISPEGWLETVTRFHQFFSLAAGSPAVLLSFHRRRVGARQVRHDHKWVRGLRPSLQLLPD